MENASFSSFSTPQRQSDEETEEEPLLTATIRDLYAYRTATARTTLSRLQVKNVFLFNLLWNFAFVYLFFSVSLSILKLAPAEYAANASSSK